MYQAMNRLWTKKTKPRQRVNREINTAQRAFLVCGDGKVEVRVALGDRTDDDLVIAADSGANRLLACGYVPDVVIGDMDSIRPEALERLREECQLLPHPVDKDYTDGELALRLAVEKGASEVVIVNDLCGRFDQAMGVAALLFVCRELGVKAHIRGHKQRVWLAESTWTQQVQAGDVVSLLPLSETVTVGSTEGLRWPLHNEELLRAATRGVSNEAITETVTVRVNSGDLLVVVIDKEKV